MFRVKPRDGRWPRPAWMTHPGSPRLTPPPVLPAPVLRGSRSIGARTLKDTTVARVQEYVGDTTPEQVKNASDAMAVLGLDVTGREQVVEPVRALGEGTGHGPHG